MRISDWSSDVCSSDLLPQYGRTARAEENRTTQSRMTSTMTANLQNLTHTTLDRVLGAIGADAHSRAVCDFSQAARTRKPSQGELAHAANRSLFYWIRSEEHTSELQSLMRTAYAVLCLKKKTNYIIQT